MKFKLNPFPKLSIDQIHVTTLLLALIVVGAALGADYQDLWPKEESVGQLGKQDERTGSLEERSREEK
jgi:hypothetical protein